MAEEIIVYNVTVGATVMYRSGEVVGLFCQEIVSSTPGCPLPGWYLDG